MMESTKTAIVLTAVILAAAGTALVLKKPPAQPIPSEVTTLTQRPALTAANDAVPEDMIDSYLSEHGSTKAFGGRVFCAHEEMGRDDNSETNPVKVYVWAYCTEYYRVGRDIKTGSAMSVPLVLTLKRIEGIDTIMAYKMPRNGSFYAPDVREMFPENIQDAILLADTEDYANRIQRLEHAVAEKRDTYFKTH